LLTFVAGAVCWSKLRVGKPANTVVLGDQVHLPGESDR
jgi:hypothetical protein